MCTLSLSFKRKVSKALEAQKGRHADGSGAGLIEFGGVRSEKRGTRQWVLGRSPGNSYLVLVRRIRCIEAQEGTKNLGAQVGARAGMYDVGRTGPS